jgi:hypothetical protein
MSPPGSPLSSVRIMIILRESGTEVYLPNCEMSASVDAIEATGEVALHSGLERAYVGILCDQVAGVLVCVPLRADPDGNVTLEAARVVG